MAHISRKITINHHASSTLPKVNAELQFDEIGFVLDASQYRDAISMVDMYHFYLRQYQYRKFRPAQLASPSPHPSGTIDEDDVVLVGQAMEADEKKRKDRAKLLLRFAMDAIRSEVHDRRRRWTWEFFMERRDDRKRYVGLYKRRESIPTLSPTVSFYILRVITLTFNYLRLASIRI
jgi:vacuolar protein sorting-associated protein 13A/C